MMRTVIGCLAGILLLVSAARAQMVYEDGFSRSGDLHGTAPETRPGTETWNVLMADPGTQSATTDSTRLNVVGGGGLQNIFAHLPFAAPEDRWFYVEADMDQTGGNDWMAIGFSSAADNGYGSNIAWMLLRNDGKMQAFESGTSGVYYNTSTAPAGSGTVTIRITIDPTQPTPTLALSVNGSQVADTTIPTATLNNIATVTIGGRQGNGSFDNFTLYKKAPPAGTMVLIR